MAHILLVVADKILNELITKELEADGHVVDQFYASESAFEKYKFTYKQKPYPVVIVDQFLPETDSGGHCDQINSLNLLQKIFYSKNWLMVKKWKIINSVRYIIRKMHFPKIILLYSNSESKEWIDFLINRREKKSSGKRTAGVSKPEGHSPIAFIQKGKEMEAKIKLKISKLEILYWQRKYRWTLGGLFFPIVAGLYIIFQNFMKQFSFFIIFYDISIVVILFILYFLYIHPNHPSLAIFNSNINTKELK